MKTRDEVTQDFVAELQALLNKYDATLMAEECEEKLCLFVEIPPGLYAFDNRVENEWLNINLGDSLWSTVKLTGGLTAESEETNER